MKIRPCPENSKQSSYKAARSLFFKNPKKTVQKTGLLKKEFGFSLIEVLVALGIISITLLAGLQAMGAMTQNAQRQWDIFLAQQCASNSLNALKLSAQFPPIGEQSLDCTQADTLFSVHLKINSTPNTSFRRVDAQVFKNGVPQLRLTTIIGRS
jgi:general secretion pathway protein I